tara:strand:- start:191 stop:643 length:453 start_codon:yes stop_codon:yes gene_type:complete
MKIYTKIIYKWIDGQLVETSSESFEYEGNLTLCGGGGGGGNTLDTVKKVVKDPVGTVKESVKPVTDPIQEQIINPVIDSIVPYVQLPMPELTPEELEEEELFDKATGKGTADRLKGIGASLAHKTKTVGAQGKFTRGSLRVRRPTSTMKA